MSTKPGYTGDPADPFPEDELETYHSPEPWRQDGRYIRDASGAIVVRGRTSADARRIVAAVNATRDMPTEALESWLVQDVSDPRTRSDLEVSLHEDPAASRFAVRPPGEAAAAIPIPAPAGSDAPPSGERREGERRRAERRSTSSVFDPYTLVFDRRVMDRRFGERREH